MHETSVRSHKTNMADEWVSLLALNSLEYEEEKKVLAEENRFLCPRIEAFEQLTGKQFIRLFRLSKELAHELVQELKPFLPQQTRRSAISAETRVLAALRFFASGSYQLSVGQDFAIHLSQPSISRCVSSVAQAISDNLLSKWVVFPITQETISISKQRFYADYGFPGVIGAIDCTHVAIVSPPSDDPIYPEHIYVNRKKFHSINVQLVSDANMVITNVNACFPGSVHDAHIWKTSEAKKALNATYEASNRKSTHWLLGDSGYPLEPWLLTPFPEENLTPSELAFNRCHKRARNTVERCNGLLKGRFRCLLQDRTLHYHPETASKIITACVVLHNMCILRNVEYDVEDVPQVPEVEVPPYNNENTLLFSEARRVRSRVAQCCFS